MIHRTLVTTACLLLVVSQSGLAADVPEWRAWRGPHGNGSVELGNYPIKFNSEKHHWRTELPGKGCSTPILLQGLIYVTAPVEGTDALLCYDLQGAEKWRTVFGKENAGKHRNGSGSNASPATDGKAIFVYFKSGTLAAV